MDRTRLEQIQSESPHLTLAQALRLAIERGIVAGEIMPDAHINENALAARLEVNRAALREALTALAEDGLVEFRRNRGAHVRSMVLEDALHLYDVRAGLARSAGRLIAERATSSDLKALSDFDTMLRDVAETEDVTTYDRINIDFHHALFACAQNPHLARLEGKVERDIRLYLRQGVVIPRYLRISCREHSEILDAVQRSDPSGAAGSFEAHVLNGKMRMLERIDLR